jgi:REP element-mobilizing transposase RayT/transcriptional regulator with XRE-family HTH domain
MPRRPRITVPGYYHVINRGVNRETIFLSDDDKEKFLEILDLSRSIYQFTLHSFCILDNHYHLMLQTSGSNLSLVMRYINSRYAEYFNHKCARVGPLWQGRYKSWYIHDERYFWLLLRYIEMNPVRAGLSGTIGEYAFSSSSLILSKQKSEILKGSRLWDKGAMDWLFPLTEDEFECLGQFQAQPLEKDKEEDVVRARPVCNVTDYFANAASADVERNTTIYQAFMDGIKQSDIAAQLGLSPAAVSKIVERERDKRALFAKIRDAGLLWSYAADIDYTEDRQGLLIETVLKYADLDDLQMLFKLFGKRKIKAVWEKCMKPDMRFKKVNYFIARMFFDMKLEAEDFHEGRYARTDTLRLLAGQNQNAATEAR